MKIRRGRPLDWRFRVNDENVAMTMRSRFSVNETEAYLQCGLEGLGLIQLSEFAASAYLRSDRLKEVLASSRCLPVPISIVYPQARATAAIRAFVDWSSRSRGRICRNEQPRQSVEVSSPASRSESAGQVVPKEKRRCFPTTLYRKWKCPCIQGFQRTQKEEVATVPERVVTAGRLANGTGTCRAVRSTVVHHSTKTDRK